MPQGGGSARPSTGNRPGPAQLPSTDRGKIHGSMGAGGSARPSMPDWFKPGASPLPGAPPSTRPSTPSQLPARPETPSRPPGANRPPATGGPERPPGIKPPGGDRPERPPGIQPPGGNRPERPPGTHPPGNRPERPPHVRPPTHPPHHPPGGGPWRPWYPGYPGYRPGHWWGWATAGAITGWVVHGWTNPIYYGYGSGGNVYYENNVVYVDGKEYGSAEQYYQEAANIAQSVPETPDMPAEEEAKNWMPLGVFALTQEGVNTSHLYLQLAVSKSGIIAGTFYNETTGATHSVEGMVDKKTQRAAWKAADGTNTNLVMETGIYNLTRDQTEVLVHFGPDQTQTWLMVRLAESERPQ
ncbi:MAG: hypothetical protein JW818_16670 [Pirellulales bacterium]|nr:hypothetical protein [Pirellulales bacterium]